LGYYIKVSERLCWRQIHLGVTNEATVSIEEEGRSTASTEEHHTATRNQPILYTSIATPTDAYMFAVLDCRAA